MKASVVLILTLFIAVFGSGQVLNRVEPYVPGGAWMVIGDSRLFSPGLSANGSVRVFQRFDLLDSLRFAGIAYLISSR